MLNVPLSIEVKGRRAFSPLAWIKQARGAARPEQDALPPHVVMRPDGVGEQHVGDFIVLRRLEDDTEILRELLELRDRLARFTGSPATGIGGLDYSKLLEPGEDHA